jgi:hypothetical protein
LNRQLLGVFFHWHALSAIRQALQEAVLALQVQHNDHATSYGQPTGHTSSELLKPLESKALQLTEMPGSLADEFDYAGASSKLQVYLAKQGWDVVITPLVQDTTIVPLVPYALRVLAVQKDGER